MNCNHHACWIDADGRQHRVTLPGLDTSCYAKGDTVTAGGQHFKLGNAHREHFGLKDGALDVSWEAEVVATPAPHLTRGRD